MGLSSSQARLLTLTSRMHDIEYKAAKLEAQKLQMANESRKAYEDYLVALDATKIQLKTIKTDGSLDYIDATYNRLMDAGYKLSSAGRIIVSQADIDYFNNMAHGNALEFACLKSGFAVKDGSYTVLASNHDIGLAFNETGLKQLVTGRKNIALMDDITVNSSLGSYSKTLDGNGKTLTVANNNGAFSYINGATIKNINLSTKDGGLNPTDVAGILAQRVSSGTTILENISISGSAKSAFDFGGLIGNATGGTLKISNITGNVQIEGTSDGSMSIGGLIGRTSNSCVTTIDNVNMERVLLRGTSQEGGIVGKIDWSNIGAKTTIENSKINIDANGTKAKGLGGIVGTLDWDADINNCYVSGTINGSAPEVVCSGAVAGNIELWKDTIDVDISNCYADITSTCSTDTGHNAYAGDIIGAVNNGSDVGITVKNVASQNGTSAAVIAASLRVTPAPNGVKDNFTQASDANAVKEAALAASAGAGATLSNTYTLPTTSAYGNFYEIGLAIQEDRVLSVDGMENNTEWLTNMINEGEILLQKPNKDGTYYDISVATDTGLQEVSDEKDLRKAEAKYEADMKKIDLKDRRYDTQLAALDNERNAIKSEMETLKTVAKDNVERTFKLFS